MNLWRRDWAVRIGTLLIRPNEGATVTVRFDVSRSTSREPNKLALQVANLSDSRVRQLSELRSPDIQLDAGYVGATETIFSGNVRDLWTVREGVDRWTKIEAQDGGTAYRTTTIQRSFGPGTPLPTVIEACARALGVGMGNVSAVAAQAELLSGGTVYPTGIALSGSAWRSLDRVLRSCGIRWSVQSGVLQLRQAGRAAVVQAVRLSPDTGLIGSPSRGAQDPRTRRVTYSASALMRPGIYPGRVVHIESKDLTANLLCKQTRHQGDTTGDTWMVDMELQEYDS